MFWLVYCKKIKQKSKIKRIYPIINLCESALISLEARGMEKSFYWDLYEQTHRKQGRSYRNTKPDLLVNPVGNHCVKMQFLHIMNDGTNNFWTDKKLRAVNTKWSWLHPRGEDSLFGIHCLHKCRDIHIDNRDSRWERSALFCPPATISLIFSPCYAAGGHLKENQ